MDTKELHATMTRALGIEELPLETQIATIDEVARGIADRVLLAILKELPKDEHAQFKALVLAGDADGAETLAGAHIPDFTAFAERARAEAFSEYQTAFQTRT